MGFILSDITTCLERVADHCSNIGVCVTQVNEDLYDTHSHLNIVKSHPDETFYHELEDARIKYQLHKNKQVDDKIPLPQAIWNEFWQRY